ncbi:MAG: type IV secretion system DNA-binding domain-containing protein [bacterium]|nr:type IV secretion system DNA-binding domain-containing protein [bacterium]
MPSPTPYNEHGHDHEVVPFAETNFRGKTQRFGIKTDDRRRHMYLIGKTGMGKTSVLEQLIYHDIQAGHGVAYLDPHGDTADRLLDYIPSHRVNDVVYFNPADLDWPIAFNVLESFDEAQKHLVASGLIGIFKKIWADSWGPRLEYVLRNAILALMDYPGTTLLGIMRILVDKDYRRKVIAMVQDPVVKSFWVDEYARYPDKFQTEAIAPIQNKVGQFLSSPLVRNIVGQVKSTIRLRDIMDNRKILIMNLAKGGVGEDNSALLGSMMVTKIYLAAMERVNIPEEERQDFYLYVDEFQNFATDAFADILSEARKYRLNLIIAHQYVGQLMTETSTRVRDAVFGNVGTLVVLRVGAQDAEFLEPEFTPIFELEDLVNIPKWAMYLKLMINGISSDPFSANTMLPIQLQYQKTGNREKVLRISRERFATPRKEIENKIAKWTGMLPSEEGEAEDTGEREEAEWTAARAKAKEYTKDIPKHREGESGGWMRDAARAKAGAAGGEEGGGGKKRPEPRIVECASCGGGATVFFQPRPGQKVLCENCMRGEKEKKKMAEVEAAKRAPRMATPAPQSPGEVGDRTDTGARQDGAPQKTEERRTSEQRAPERRDVRGTVKREGNERPPRREGRGGGGAPQQGRGERGPRREGGGERGGGRGPQRGRDDRAPQRDQRPPRREPPPKPQPSAMDEGTPVVRGGSGGGKELSLGDLLGTSKSPPPPRREDEQEGEE